MKVEGLEHLPRKGPALIAARHYHHLYDGATLVMKLPRMVHIFVALDWARDARERRIMEIVCSAARWPVVLRPQRFANGDAGDSAYASSEIARYVRKGLADASQLLREGRVVCVFPEGFPTIEPFGRRMRGDDELLEFAAGFTSIAMLAQRGGRPPVPILPAGFQYAPAGDKQGVTLRLGEPMYLDGSLPRDAVVRAVEAEVRRLSGIA
jgi:putative membrane protein